MKALLLVDAKEKQTQKFESLLEKLQDAIYDATKLGGRVSHFSSLA